VKEVATIAQAKARGSGSFEFPATETRTPYTADYTGGDANKTAHYMLRWISTRGEKGRWSVGRAVGLSGGTR
jgi:hypothetical protein